MPIHKGYLPREGFCLDVVLGLVRATALNPTLLLPIILLARFTRRGQALALLHPTALGRLQKLACLGLARVLSGWLSDRVRNNWVRDEYVWSKEIVVVTGGAGGIGGAIVRLFDELGVTVVVLDVQPMSFETCKPPPPLQGKAPFKMYKNKELTGVFTASKVHYYQCDLRSPQSVNAIADQIRADVGHPTVLINNAGVARGKTLLESQPSDVRFTFDVNTFAHFWVVKAFLPHLVSANHGMIVTVSSYASWLTIPNMVDYGASKAAALSFHEGLTAELQTVYDAPRVRTVSVHPGHTSTALFKGYDQKTAFIMPELQPETIAEAIVNQVLSGKSGHVIVPEAGNMLALLRFMPDWYQIRTRAKGASFMKKWNGRQVIADVDTSVEDSTVLVSGEAKAAS